MADKIPVKAIYTLTDVTSLGEFNAGDTIPVANGGTGASTASGARTSLGLDSMAVQNATSVNIDGGTIDSTVIGGTTPAAGSFTTLSATQAKIGDGTGTSQSFVHFDNAGSNFYVGSEGSVAGGYFANSSAYASVLYSLGTPVEIIVDGVKSSFSSTGLAVAGALGTTTAGATLFTGTAGTVNGFFGGGGGSAEMALGTTSNVPVTMYVNGVKQATIDAAGNLGLGVTPNDWSGGVAKGLNIGTYTAFGQGSGGEFIAGQNFVHVGSHSYTYKTNFYATRYEQQSGAHKWYIAPIGTAGDPIIFTQAMTMDASGNLLVGQATTGYQDSNSASIQNATGMNLVVNHLTGTASGSGFAFFGYAGVGIGSITQNGTTAVAYNTTSDHRLKENVRPANAARFNDIEFVDFEWVDGRHDCGVIAHQLQSVYPDLVLGEKDATEVRQVEISPAIPAVLDEEGNEVTQAVEAVFEDQTFQIYQQVNYIGLIGRMGTRIQLQDKAIAALEARLAALEAK
jgi:hypothetical protein